jgi:hypothetical protein
MLLNASHTHAESEGAEERDMSTKPSKVALTGQAMNVRDHSRQCLANPQKSYTVIAKTPYPLLMIKAVTPKSSKGG